MRARLATLALLVAGSLVLAAPAVASEELLPDLTQGVPYELGVSTDGKTFHLGFASVVYNYGEGPLAIKGARASTSDPTMTATQYVDLEDGSQVTYGGIGDLRYVDAITHMHWHYLRFSAYSLRSPDGRRTRVDRKTGFCVGDRVRAPDPAPRRADEISFGGNCGNYEPDLLEVNEGIAPGYGDDYGPQLEGQYLDLTKVPAGRYVLVHTANPDGVLRETTLGNNSSSVLIDLRWRGRTPIVKQVAGCPGSATCPLVPALTPERAVALARSAFRRGFKRPADGISCGEPVEGKSSCLATLDGRPAVATVGYVSAGGRLYWTYAAWGQGRAKPRRGRVAVSLGKAKTVPLTRQPRGSQRAARVGYCPIIGRARAGAR